LFIDPGVMTTYQQRLNDKMKGKPALIKACLPDRWVKKMHSRD